MENKNDQKRTWKDYFRRERTSDKVFLYLAWILRISFLTLSIRGIIIGDMLITTRTLLVFILLLIPPIVDISLKIRVPTLLDLMIVLSLFLHQRGVIFGIYDLIPYYDMILHTFSSIVLASLILLVIYLLERNWDGLKMSPGAIALFTVLSTMAMGVIWEIAEFFLDQTFGYNTQPGLVDTMQDLILDTVGSSLVAIIFLIKVRGTGLSPSMEELNDSFRAFVSRRTKSS